MCHYLVSRIFDWLFPPPLPNSFADWMDIAKIVGAGIAFWIGLQQYRRSQLWKRLEFVSAQMKIFFDDSAVRATMQMLDWRKKDIQLFKARGEDNEVWVTVYYELVAIALGTDPAKHYDDEQSAIRDLVERFLEYLARFEGFLRTKVVEPQDLDPYLDYWVKLLSGRDDHSPEVTRLVLPSLWKFIDYYGYQDVRRFVNRYHAVAFSEFKA
jgi:hypothetical protein